VTFGEEVGFEIGDLMMSKIPLSRFLGHSALEGITPPIGSDFQAGSLFEQWFFVAQFFVSSACSS
jgi:hypothetical protein